MQKLRLLLALSASAVVGVIAACVGDDPAPEGGPAGASDASTVEDGTSGSDAATAGDAGADACANVDLQNDARNCGACGHDCLHGACKGGACAPWVVATVDGGTLYGPGTDGAHVFYSIDGIVWRVQADGGAPVQMTSGLDARAFAKGPAGMLACGTLGVDDGVYQLPVNPGGLPTLVHDVAPCIALAVDGTTVWAGRTIGVDEITPAATSAHQFVPFSERLTGGIDVSGTRLYWVNQNTGVLNAPKAMPDAGRAPLNKDPINEANGLAVTNAYAYVTARPAGPGGILLRLALDGGASSVLLTDLPQTSFQQGVARAPGGALFFAAGPTLYGYVPPP